MTSEGANNHPTESQNYGLICLAIMSRTDSEGQQERNKSDIICLLKKDQHDFKTKMHNISSAVSQGALIRLIKASECITDAGLWSWEMAVPGSTRITFKSLNYQAVLELLESWHCTSITWELALPGITSSTWDSAFNLRVGIAIVTSFTRIQYSVLQPSNCVIISWFY